MMFSELWKKIFPKEDYRVSGKLKYTKDSAYRFQIDGRKHSKKYVVEFEVAHRYGYIVDVPDEYEDSIMSAHSSSRLGKHSYYYRFYSLRPDLDLAVENFKEQVRVRPEVLERVE